MKHIYYSPELNELLISSQRKSVLDIYVWGPSNQVTKTALIKLVIYEYIGEL